MTNGSQTQINVSNIALIIKEVMDRAGLLTIVNQNDPKTTIVWGSSPGWYSLIYLISPDRVQRTCVGEYKEGQHPHAVALNVEEELCLYDLVGDGTGIYTLQQ